MICLLCRFPAARNARNPTSLKPELVRRRILAAIGLHTQSKAEKRLPESPARTRFAPSPTGYLHLGSLRTALFNYLLARRTGGQFVLRIEDTDQKRTIPDAEQRIYDDLRWTGLNWDEGPDTGGPYGPYRQSERTSLYSSETQKLVSSGHAYRCFCTPERLDALAKQRHQHGLSPGYDGSCRAIPKEESDDRASRGERHTIRLLAIENPIFQDLVYGKSRSPQGPRNATTTADPILIKSDGHPTYHLANVVDDHHMKITHVIRGTEWVSSTSLHVALYNAFGWEPPAFAHVPLLVDKAGQKLSKREGDTDISHFRDDLGIFPSTLANFAALLGWSHTQPSDMFSLQELEKAFDLKLTKGNVKVAYGKLWFLQKAHAARCIETKAEGYEGIVDAVTETARKTYTEEEMSLVLKSRDLRSYVDSLLQVTAQRYTTPNDFVTSLKPFFTQSIERPEYTHPTSIPPNLFPRADLEFAAADICDVPFASWNASTLDDRIQTYVQSYSLGVAPDDLDAERRRLRNTLCRYLRWAIFASTPGPSVTAWMEVLGPEESIRRLKQARESNTEAGET